MKFLSRAVFWGIVGLVSLVALSQSSGLERLRTVDGREFHGIWILGADSHGLSFRHEKGIAKLPFSSLPEDLRRRYEPTTGEMTGTAGKEAAPAGGADGEAEGGEEWSEEWDGAEVCLPSPVVVRAHSRVRLPHPVLFLDGGCCRDRVAWPHWWPRHARVHELTRPYCRELAVRDFLYRSGLLPAAREPGVRAVFH